MNMKPRIFLSFSFTDDTKNVVDAFKEVGESHGFTVVTGEPPGGPSPPELVRSRILSSDCFAAILTSTDVESRASAWISNEIGMAYALDLRLMICPEDTVEDLGLAKMATSYNDFNRNNLASFKSGLHVYFREIKQKTLALRKARLSETSLTILRVRRSVATRPHQLMMRRRLPN